MTNEEAKSLLEPMSPATKLAVARAVRASATDAAGGRPIEGFIADVFDKSDRLIIGDPHDWQIVLDAYLEVVLADAVTPEELLNAHRRVVDTYTE